MPQMLYNVVMVLLLLLGGGDYYDSINWCSRNGMTW